MNKYLIILGLEALLEQLVDSRENSNDYKERIKEIEKQINIMKEYTFDYNFPNPIDGSNDSILIYKNK